MVPTFSLAAVLCLAANQRRIILAPGPREVRMRAWTDRTESTVTGRVDATALYPINSRPRQSSRERTARLTFKHPTGDHRSASSGITSRANRSRDGFSFSGSIPGGTPKPISSVNGSRS